VWMKVKDAGKLDSQAVEAHFVGYDEESKGYRLYFPKRRVVVVERDVYFDKDAVIEVGDVVFERGTKNEGGNEETTDFSNPTYIPNKTATSAPKTPEIQGPDSPRTMPEIAPMLPEVPEASKEPEIPKPHRNSLSGLPQYDPTEYG
jgi:hypothetical protein